MNDTPKPPRIVGKPLTFTAHGSTFICKKLSQSVYYLECPLKTPRTRFGTREEIAADIASAIETGALPGSVGRP